MRRKLTVDDTVAQVRLHPTTTQPIIPADSLKLSDEQAIATELSNESGHLLVRNASL